ncbi:hypothetical protein [Streptomyces hirsutus]|uniref:hypothetical protein n=1 Tax=Streptomyces hirsutus TaxID=35620 RepID=UPI003675EC94
MTRLSPDVRAVVAAVDRLTTQVERLADARQTPTDDATTTPGRPVVGIDPGMVVGQWFPEPPGAKFAARVREWAAHAARAAADDAPTTAGDALPRHMKRHSDGRLHCLSCNTTGIWPGLPLHDWQCPDRPRFVPPVADTADAPPPTPDDGPRCVCGDPLTWYTAPGGGAGWVHGPDLGSPIFDVHKPRPADGQAPAEHCEHDGPHNGFTCGEVDQTRLFWEAQWARDAEQARHPGSAADEEQTLRWARRESLLVLLTRLQRGRTLTEDEAGALRHHLETEMREADIARADLARYEEVQGEMNERAIDLTRRAAQAEDLLRVAHETSNKSEAERARAVQRAERAEAALESARALHRPRIYGGQTICGACSDYDPSSDSTDSAPVPYGQCPTLRALDGTEQPTTTEPS